MGVSWKALGMGKAVAIMAFRVRILMGHFVRRRSSAVVLSGFES
jgi:hypothetical protein